MTQSMDDILHPGVRHDSPSDFPDAPGHWTPDIARSHAQDEQLELTQEHWSVVRVLQDYYARHPDGFNARELHDALHERFHSQGGIRFVYALFSGGPVAQGCRISGLPIPPGAVDKGFGSVM